MESIQLDGSSNPTGKEVSCACVCSNVYIRGSVQLKPGGTIIISSQGNGCSLHCGGILLMDGCRNLMCRRFGMGKCTRRVLRQARALNQATDTLLKFILNCAATNSFLRVLPYAMHACRLQPWRAISFVLSRTRNHECRNIGSKCVCSLCCISSQAVKGTLPSVDSSKESPNRLHSRPYAK